MDQTADSVERYDRQIRLWGQHGQFKCSNAKICLINANSLGTEILKGLCLAGICSFSILDSHKLLPEDIDCNFIPESCLGKNRGESVKSMLLDLNEEVNGEVFSLEKYLPHVTQASPTAQCDTQENDFKDLNFWKQFNCIIASGFLYIDQITRLSKICWLYGIPLILCKSIGFYGSMKCQYREHLIIETHPDNVLPDFNLDKPFKDLKDYFDSIDLKSESNSNDNKINSYPYIVIIYKHLKLWQKKHNFPEDRLPNCYSEKLELKKEIENSYKDIRDRIKTSTNRQDYEITFENYLEASKAINSCLSNTSELPKNVKQIFDNSKATTTSCYINSNNNNSMSTFWIIIKAIKEFVLNKNDGKLPVSGTIPDMISSSEEYIRLQGIYRKKAKEDVDVVFSIIQNSTNSMGISGNQLNGSLYEEIKLLCKNIRTLEVITTSPLYEENDFVSNTFNEEDEEDEYVTIGLSLKSMDLFFSTYGRLPGCQDDQVETDLSKLKECVKQIVGKVSNRLKTLDQCLYELCRYGGAEIHATSAFLGGCIGQEVIKIITNQYTPVNDTLVYNAMTASARAFKFQEAFEKR